MTEREEYTYCRQLSLGLARNDGEQFGPTADDLTSLLVEERHKARLEGREQLSDIEYVGAKYWCDAFRSTEDHYEYGLMPELKKLYEEAKCHNWFTSEVLEKKLQELLERYSGYQMTKLQEEADDIAFKLV